MHHCPILRTRTAMVDDIAAVNVVVVVAKTFDVEECKAKAGCLLIHLSRDG